MDKRSNLLSFEKLETNASLKNYQEPMCHNKIMTTNLGFTILLIFIVVFEETIFLPFGE